MAIEPDRVAPAKSLQGIQGHLILLLFIMFASTLLIQLYDLYERYRTSRSEQLQANLEIARAASGMFKEFVRDVLRQELGIGITFTLPLALSVEQMNAILDENCRENPVIRSFAWATPEGRTIASNLPRAIGLDITKYPYYKEIISGKDYVISDLYTSQVDGAPCFSINSGIRDKTGSLLGIIIAVVVPDRLDQIIAVERARGGSIAFVDGKGMLVYRYPELVVTWEERNWLKEYPQLEEVLKGKEAATTVHAPYKGKKLLVGFTPIASIAWAAVGERTEDAAMTAIKASLLPHTMSFLFVTALTFGVTLLLSRKISTPVGQLRKQALALSRGETVIPVIASGPTELNDLADSFNAMAFELRSRETSLRDQREWFRVTLSSIGDGVMATDATGRIIFINPSAVELTGWQADEAEGQLIQEVFRIIDEHTRKPGEDIVGQVLNEGKVALLANHIVLLSRDGREIPVEDSAAPIRDETGRILGVVLVFHDVTEKRKARQELSEVNRRLKVILDSIADGFYALDTELRFTHINDAALRLFDTERGEMIGRSIYDVLPRFRESVFEAAYRRAISSGEPEHLESSSIVTGRTMEVHAYPGPDNMTVLFRDVTDRKRLEERLRRAYDEMEMRVEERTAELVKVNEALKTEIAERRRGEDALKKERQRLHEVLDLLPAYVLLLDPDYHVPFMNRFFHARFGESGGRRCFEWLFGRAAPCESCETYTVLKTNGPHRWEWTDPVGRQYDVHDFPFTDTDGSPLILEVGIDITELRRAEQSLREANETLELRVAERTAELAIARNEALSEKNRLEVVMETLPVGVAIRDERGRNIRSNETYETLWGSPGRSSQDVRDPEAHKAWWADTGELVRPEEWASDRAVRKGETVVGQLMEIEHFDGMRKFIMYSAAPVHDAQGNNIGCAVVIQDVTDIKRAEREVQNRAAELEAVFAAQGDAVLMYDTEMNVKRANPAFFSVYGFDPIGLNVEEIIRRVSCRWLDGQPCLLDGQRAPQILDGKQVTGVCLVVTRPDGTNAVIETSSKPMRQGDRIIGSVAVWHDITELKRAEKELKESEERFRMLSQTAGRLLVSEDPQEILNELCGKIMAHLNCQVFFNYLVNEEEGRLHLNASAGILDEDVRKIEWLDYGAAVCGCAVRDGVPIVAEDILNHSDCRTRLVKSYGIQAYCCHPLKAHGRVVGTLSFGSRVRMRFSPEELSLMRTVADQVATAMERMNLIEKLKKSRDELDVRVRERTEELLMANQRLQEQASLLDLAHDAIIVQDLNHRVVYWNRGAEETYGWTEEEALDKVAHELLQTQSPVLLEEMWRELLVNGKWEGEFCQSTRYGSSMIMASRQRLRKNAQGIPTGIFEINRDVTAYKRAEEEISQAKAMLQMVFDGISDPLFMLGQDLSLKMLNQAAYRYFNVSSSEDVIGKSCYDLTQAKCLFCDECEIQQAISKGKNINFERKGLFNPDSIEQVTVYPLDESLGGVSGAIVGIVDITESRKLEEHMMRVDRLSSLGQLSAGIAHEIRNPLAGINLFVDLLTDEEKFQRTAQETNILEEIKRNIKKIDGIIKRVLEFSRQPDSVARSRIDVGQLIDETLKIWRSEVGRRGIVLNVSVEVGIPQVLGDSIELQQVLNNLLQNAVDVMSQGGRLSIRAHQGLSTVDKTRRIVMISVRDTGPGIPDEHRESVFNPFYTTKPTGTGLGLAISHRIITRHQGAIFFESASSGTTFHIELPVASGE